MSPVALLSLLSQTLIMVGGTQAERSEAVASVVAVEASLAPFSSAKRQLEASLMNTAAVFPAIRT